MFVAVYENIKNILRECIKMKNRHHLDKKDRIRINRRIPVKYGIVACIVVCAQLFLFVSVFILWGNAANEKKKCYQQFKNIVSARTISVQDYISEKQNVLVYMQNEIEDKINVSSVETLNSTGKDPCGEYYYNEGFIDSVCKEIYNLLALADSKGAFIVMNSAVSGESHQGLYVRRQDNGNIELIIGKEELAGSLKLGMSDDWQETFRITDLERCDYFNILKDENEENNGNEYGCVCPKYKLYGHDEDILTYTVPLRDEKGCFYGVLGIEFSISALQHEMPFTELGSGTDNMYYLAYREDDSQNAVKEVLSANAGTDVSDSNGRLNYSEYKNSMYQIKNDNNTYIVVPEKLVLDKLINDGSTWNVYGIVNRKSLLESYYTMIFDTIVLLSVLLLSGGFAIWYGYLNIGRQMRKMAVQIRNSNPHDGWNIDSFGSFEFDELGNACRELFEKSMSSSKLAETIELINVPIGAIEYDSNNESVFCSSLASEILELHNVDADTPYMNKSLFDSEVDVLKKSLNLYEENSDVYHMISKTGKDKFIRIKTLQDHGKWLIALMDVTEEIKERKRIEYERDHDLMTHLLNRMAFRRQVEGIMNMQDLGMCAIVMIDLDNLKYFNDTYGHDYGDKYICAAASVLGKVMSDKVFVSRMSGDEFLIFLYGFDTKEEIKEIVDRIHNDLREACVQVPTGDRVRLRASAGVSWYPENADNLDDLIRYADYAMYESKNNMKGTINEFNSEQFRKNKVIFQGSEELNRLVEDSANIRYAFHPIVDAHTGEIFAYEALMRPQIESLKSPEDVMRLATSQSRLYDIELMTWNESLKAASVQRKPGDNYYLFINSIPNHELRGDDLEKIVSSYGHLLNRVVIEIIENEQADKHCMDSKFNWAQKYGMNIALDDFGTGYSNESTLLFINPQFVKIDMSMVKGISDDENRQKMVQNLISYTKPRGIKVIAEGIENYEDMATLISLDVDYLQGWYFTKPVFEIKPLDEKFKKEIKECNDNKIEPA